MAEYENAENQLEQAIRAGYLTTDKEFLSQVEYQLKKKNKNF